MIVLTDKEVYSDAGKLVHRINSNSYFKRCSKLSGDLITDFEEVDEIPEINENYGEEVNSKIRERYTLSEELAILRQRDSKPQEFDEYYKYAEACKLQVKTNK